VPNSYVFSTVVKEDEALDLQEGQDTVSKSIEVFHEVTKVISLCKLTAFG